LHFVRQPVSSETARAGSVMLVAFADGVSAAQVEEFVLQIVDPIVDGRAQRTQGIFVLLLLS
jgi:hypothetical protein